ncbi:MAG: hypothetical protein QOI10_1694 [Solirubrobacterales bacterium]|nr:hypothetical protein [Solirubrobacterales bacterium]
MTSNETQINSAMTIRRLDVGDSDRAALARLAGLDSRQELEGPVLGAEVEGRLLAAISIESGELIADPFSRTSELRALLKLRASQLQERRVERRGSRVFGRRSPRPALGGSPAGHLVTLQRGL